VLPTAGPAVLTARGRQALVAEQCHHRHGAIFLLVREKKKYQKAQLQLELLKDRGALLHPYVPIPSS
jgi:hypothetical protein